MHNFLCCIMLFSLDSLVYSKSYCISLLMYMHMCTSAVKPASISTMMFQRNVCVHKGKVTKLPFAISAMYSYAQTCLFVQSRIKTYTLHHFRYSLCTITTQVHLKVPHFSYPLLDPSHQFSLCHQLYSHPHQCH